MHNLNYDQAVKNAPHLIALGDSVVYLHDDQENFPWHLVNEIESGCGFRLNGPTGFYAIAKDPSGLTFKLSVEMEERSASGSSVNQFDGAKLKDIARKLPPQGKKALATFFKEKVLPEVSKRTIEWRSYLNKQEDSEAYVRTILSFTEQAH